ncbi:hypothetical protein E05_20330 [Plautia stali symbiont]|nr:hypothetical protein E05_20330 [Plautia stali symbiont]
MKTEDNMAQKSATDGFAPAVQPTAASTIITASEAIHAGETSVPSQGENLPAYYARPQQFNGTLPVVLVVQEIFGVHEHIRDLCRRLALEVLSRRGAGALFPRRRSQRLQRHPHPV